VVQKPETKVEQSG